MSEQITTKDLQSLGELMTFEAWAATKAKNYAEMVESPKLRTTFETMAQSHLARHGVLLDYLKKNKG